MPIDSDTIGIEYKIDLVKLKASIEQAEQLLVGYNRNIANLAKKTVSDIKTSSGSVDKISSASLAASQQLQKLGITSTTTAAEIKAMNLSALDTQKVLNLTRQRMKELGNETIATGKSTKIAENEFVTLQKRMPHLEHEVNKGVKAFGDYRRAIDRWGQGFKYMMLSQAAWIASGAVLFGTLAAIGKGFKDVIEYHQGMKTLQAITGGTAEEIKLMANAINDAAVATKFFAGDMTKAAIVMGQAGFTANEVAASIGGIALLASAANKSLEDTADVMTTVIRAYELNASESTKIANILAAGIAGSKLQIEDLRTAFNYMAVAAHQFNLSLEDTVGWLGILRDRGLKASTIGTSFRMVLASLVRETKKFKDVLRDLKEPLGFADVTIRNGRKVEEVMKRLAKAGFDVADAFVALPQRTAMTFSLMVQNVQAFEKLREEVTGTNKAVEMNIIQMEGLEYQLKQMRSIFFEVIRAMSRSGGMLEPFIATAKYVIQLYGAAGVAIAEFFNIMAKSISVTAAHLAVLMENLQLPEIDFSKFIFRKGAKGGVIFQMPKLTGIFGDKEKVEKMKNEIMEIYEAFGIDVKTSLEATMKSIERIVSPDIRTPAEKEIAKTTNELSKLYKRQKEVTEQFEQATKGTESWATLRNELVLVNAQIRELEKTAGLLEDSIVGPVESLQNILLDLTIDPDMKASELLAVFRKGEEDINLLRKAVNKLKDDYIEAHSKWQTVLSKDTEEYKRMIELAKTLVEVQKKLGSLESGIAKKRDEELNDEVRAEEQRLKFILKRYGDELREISKFEKDKETILKKFLSFAESVDKDLDKTEEDSHERKIKLQQNAADKRVRIYKQILNEAEKFYEKLKLAASIDPLLTIEKEDFEAKLAKIREFIAEIEKTDKGEKKQIIDPSDFSRGIIDGLRDARKELSNEYDIWKNLTTNSAMAMRDSFSDLFFDAMKGELKSLGDYWQAFTNAVKRQIADMVASWITSGLGKTVDWVGVVLKVGSVVAGAGGGPTDPIGAEEIMHSGGQIKRMHSGGGLAGNETLRILKENEYVIKDSSARSIGLAPLDYMNKTGKIPSSGGITHINNSYTIIAMDSESIDQALRRGGAKAIQDISIGTYMYERERRNPAFGMR